jgi:Concanavalin A-like lectin/glucanases superfamily
MSLISGTDGAIAAAGLRGYSNLVINTGPVAWWPLDVNLVDRIGGRNGVLGAGAQVPAGALPGESGGSFNCAGANWIQVAHAAVLKPAVGSIMAWFKPASINSGGIISANTSGQVDDHFVLQVVSNGTIHVTLQNAAHTPASPVIETAAAYYTPGQTVHAVVTFDGSGFALYLDGNRIGTSDVHTTGLASNTLGWRFGSDEFVGIFDGVIDEIAIWDRVLTRLEIYRLAQVEFIP